MMRCGLYALLLMASSLLIAQPDSVDISISLDGPQAGIASSGVGSELGTGVAGCYYVDASNTLYIKIQFSGLSGTVSAAHIHGPAPAGISAGVVQGLTGFPTGSTSGSYTNSFVLSDLNERYLLNDSLYINIHTSFAGGGEIRGQLLDNGALPVELTSFTAVAKGKSVELTWKTATEVNNHGFVVERSAVSGQWTEIGFVEGHGTVNSAKEYSYRDDVPTSGKYLYRLKQVDNDGAFEYSASVEVKVSQMPQKLALMQNHPNPFNPVTMIKYQLPMNGHVTLKVYDMLGKEIATLVNGEQSAGEYTVPFDASSYPSGIYFYTLRTENSVETKKMMLVK